MSDDLDQIAARASADDALAVQLTPEEQAKADKNPVKEWQSVAHQVGALICAGLPEVRPDWTAARLDALGEALAACAERYGWTAGALLSHPLLLLAVASFPLAASVGRAVQARKAMREAPPVEPNEVQQS